MLATSGLNQKRINKIGTNMIWKQPSMTVTANLSITFIFSMEGSDRKPSQ